MREESPFAMAPKGVTCFNVQRADSELFRDCVQKVLKMWIKKHPGEWTAFQKQVQCMKETAAHAKLRGHGGANIRHYAEIPARVHGAIVKLLGISDWTMDPTYRDIFFDEFKAGILPEDAGRIQRIDA